MKERLQKIIARSGIASRRAAERMIQEGRVSVNQRSVTALGTKADERKDEIRIDGKLIAVNPLHIYLMLHKPRGFVTTLKDPQGRPIVTDLIKGIQERVFPVGRLDYDSEGLLLLTNDGEFAYKVQHPKFEISKTYMVKIKGTLSGEEMKTLKEGVQLQDGLVKPLRIGMEKKNKKNSWIEMTISEGRNRVVRRFFESIERPVIRLVRIAISAVELGTLRPGEFRYLSEKEIKRLRGD